MTKENYYIASFSGGKDSTAMLIKLLELKMPVNEILFCDTGVEFPQMYEHVKEFQEKFNVKINMIKSEKDFNYYLCEHKKTRGNNRDIDGYGFPSRLLRWCTARLKTEPKDKYITQLKKKYNVYVYVGFASDEKHRVKENSNEIYPLIDLNLSEKDCLQICTDNGFTWGGLYELFPRTGCWLCPLQRVESLRKLYNNYPELWAKLEEMQLKVPNSLFKNKGVFYYSDRFKKEQEIKCTQI